MISVLSILLAAVCAASAQPLDAERIFRDNSATVVVVLAGRGDGPGESQGSGVCVDTRGYVLCTAHQVQNAGDLRGRLSDGSQRALQIVRIDEERDLALLKADAALPKAALLGDSSALPTGAQLAAIAAPQRLEFTITTGIVSSLRRNYHGKSVIQTTIPVSPGSSGGPVFDAAGSLVGVVFGRVEDVEGASLIYPLEDALPLLRDVGLIAGGPNGETGEFDRVSTDDLAAGDLPPVEAYNRAVAAEARDEKIRLYRTAVAQKPDFYEAWFNLGVVMAAVGDHDDARDAYQKAEALRPEALEVHRNLGRLLMKQRRYSEVLAHFQRAEKLAPNDPVSQNDLGVIYRLMGDLESARARFVKALELTPDYAAAEYNLGLTFAQLNEKAAAATHFERYLGLRPGAGDAAEVREWVAELRAAPAPQGK